MPLLSAFRCLFKGITTNTNSLTGRSAFFHSSGLFSKLFVGGLSVNTNEEVLRDAFSLYGRILEVSVIVDYYSGRSKGFGYVQFASEMEADNALGKMDGQFLDGRNIHVDIACPRLRYIAPRLPTAVGPPPGLLRAEGPPPGANPRILIDEARYLRRRIKRFRAS